MAVGAYLRNDTWRTNVVPLVARWQFDDFEPWDCLDYRKRMSRILSRAGGVLMGVQSDPPADRRSERKPVKPLGNELCDVEIG
jgi:hypothetical protein